MNEFVVSGLVKRRAELAGDIESTQEKLVARGSSQAGERVAVDGEGFRERASGADREQLGCDRPRDRGWRRVSRFRPREARLAIGRMRCESLVR
jgi:hypothetical protein